MVVMLGVFVACGSDNDEPTPNDDNNKEQPADPKNPEKEENPESELVSAEEFLKIVDGNVWVHDTDFERVYVHAKGEEFPISAIQTSSTSMVGLSFREGKMAILLWPAFVKASYKDYTYNETTGEIFISDPNKSVFIVESITPERIVYRSDIDEVPKVLGKDQNQWAPEDYEPEKGSYSREALIIADEETTRNYLENY